MHCNVSNGSFVKLGMTHTGMKLCLTLSIVFTNTYTTTILLKKKENTCRSICFLNFSASVSQYQYMELGLSYQSIFECYNYTHNTSMI